MKSIGYTLSFILIFCLMEITTGWAQSLELPVRSWQEANYCLQPPQAAQIMMTSSPSRKSTKLAMLMSAILPGWGQWYVGSKSHTMIFMSTEAAVWTTRGWLKKRQGWREDDYKLYATVHAGIEPNGKSSDYFSHLQNYNSSDDYNDNVRREARLAEITPEGLYGEEDGWQWDSRYSRKKYDSYKDDAWRYKQWASYMIGAALINRLLAVVDTARLAKKHNKNVDSVTRVRFQLNDNPQNPGFQLSLTKKY